MPKVVIHASGVVNFPHVGGHFWVFLNWAHCLRRLGCEVYWLERFFPSGDAFRDERLISSFLGTLEGFGFRDRAILYTQNEDGGEEASAIRFYDLDEKSAKTTLRRSDLLLNFYYRIHPLLLDQFSTTALVDIDPGLLQFWLSLGQIEVAPHDHYFTIGETVGIPAAKFSPCDLPWVRMRPPVALDLWPFVFDPGSEAFTTVSSWWGGSGRGEWITDGEETFYENNKRASFLRFLELPDRTDQVLELALYMGDGDPDEPAIEESSWEGEKPFPEELVDYKGDAVDRAALVSHGWRVRHSMEVSPSPEAYRRYVQGSRGEFSCCKPSCIRLENAWVSDRSAAYLATGKPVVVQHTGPSGILPNGPGMYRFSTVDEAAEALDSINRDYEANCQAAREIAEAYFSGERILERVLDIALGSDPWRPRDRGLPSALERARRRRPLRPSKGRALEGSR